MKFILPSRAAADAYEHLRAEGSWAQQPWMGPMTSANLSHDHHSYLSLMRQAA